MFYIKDVNIWVPPMQYSQEELLECFGLSKNEKARKIFGKTAISKRHFITPASQLLKPVKNQVKLPSLKTIYPDMGSINWLVEVSNLNTRRYDLPGVHLKKHWCPGAVYGIATAMENKSKSLLVTIDINSLLRWESDFADINDVVAYSLFGDAIASLVIENVVVKQNEIVPYIIDVAFYHDLRNDVIGYKDGKLYLSQKIPEITPPLIDLCLSDLFKGHQISRDDIKYWIVHPGGRRILDNIESHFSIDLNFSRKTLRNYGNVGASSVLFILKEVINNKPHPGDYGVIVSFGPSSGFNCGFTIACCLLQWS